MSKPNDHRRPVRGRIGAATALALSVALTLSACGETAPGESEETVSPTPQPTGQTQPVPTSTASPTSAPTPTPTPAPTSSPSATETGALPPGTADPVDPEPTDAGDAVTEADSGQSVTVPVGDEIPLRLGSSWYWAEPVIDGDAISLTTVDYFQDPGFVEWLIVGEQPGAARITVSGEPACDDSSQCPPMEFELDVEVTG